jgi:hypothetical protein
MAVRVVRLGDPDAPDAPFTFRKGDRVAWKRWDGSPDPEFSGEITDGICEYVPGGGAYRDRYVVRREDGSFFGAEPLDLIKL